jgi:hypothetical protein
MVLVEVSFYSVLVIIPTAEDRVREYNLHVVMPCHLVANHYTHKLSVALDGFQGRTNTNYKSPTISE